jgi:hypothetical protein
VTAATRRMALLAALAICVLPSIGSSQEWRATARFGRVAYEGAPAGGATASSVVFGLGRAGLRDWFGASAALPLGGDPFWAVLAGWKRLETRGAAGLLLDLSGHGFVQRHTVRGTTERPGGLPTDPLRPPSLTETDLSGAGIGAELMTGGFATAGALRLEARAGAALQRSQLGDVLQERALPSGDARLSIVLAPFTLQAETRGWLDADDTHAYGGGTIHLSRGPLQLWGSAGRWVAGGVDGMTWSAGLGTAVGEHIELQLGGRGNAFDPLYLSATETSLWAGLSMRVGGESPVRALMRAPVPARYEAGRAAIRIRASEATGTPSIAGDFTSWKPVPMRRVGSHWTYEAPLVPGVYHYAFVGEDGTWFVPESVPGRQDDGMGGHVAVLVVS